MNILIRWFINALSLFIVSRIIPGIEVRDFVTALVAAVIIGLVNAVLKPILLILTLPINVLTLGLFTFVINALLLMLAGSVIPGFVVRGFMPALIGSILLSLISTVLVSLVE